MRRQIDEGARQSAQWRQAARRWAKKMKPFEDIIACLVGLSVGIAMGMAVVGAYNLRPSTAPPHRHHAATMGTAPAAAQRYRAVPIFADKSIGGRLEHPIDRNA